MRARKSWDHGPLHDLRRGFLAAGSNGNSAAGGGNTSNSQRMATRTSPSWKTMSDAGVSASGVGNDSTFLLFFFMLQFLPPRVAQNIQLSKKRWDITIEG